ncbi:hypothetical protein B0H12DRAFT_1145530 [Mycena haematopus]|nr:hypothetical protein B0H12DRAFT_1145530 [Mycena haematopus]
MLVRFFLSPSPMFLLSLLHIFLFPPSSSPPTPSLSTSFLHPFPAHPSSLPSPRSPRFVSYPSHPFISHSPYPTFLPSLPHYVALALALHPSRPLHSFISC